MVADVNIVYDRKTLKASKVQDSIACCSHMTIAFRTMVLGTAALSAFLVGGPMVRSESIPPPDSYLSNGKWTITPAELKWDKGFFGGSPHAAILGDDTKQGLYVYRTRIPKGQRTPVHVHPDYRFVTVISGTLLVGFTPTFEEKSMTVLPVGGAWIEPVRHAHYIWAKEGDVVVQVMGFGPTKMIPYSSRPGVASPDPIKTNLP
jgi:quercetin dioxygenase-like cupin family protein